MDERKMLGTVPDHPVQGEADGAHKALVGVVGVPEEVGEEHGAGRIGIVERDREDMLEGIVRHGCSIRRSG
jgi:hypothetical protein